MEITSLTKWSFSMYKEKRSLQKLLLFSPHVQQPKEGTVWFLSFITASCALHPASTFTYPYEHCILTYSLWVDCMFLFSSSTCQPFEIYPLLEHTIQFLGSCIWLWPDCQASLCWSAVHRRPSPSLLALLLSSDTDGLCLFIMLALLKMSGCFQWGACIFSCLLLLLETYFLPLDRYLRALSLDIAWILQQSFCSLSKGFAIRNFST